MKNTQSISTPYWFNWKKWLRVGIIIFILGSIYYFFFYSPRPTANYFVEAIKKIGAPSGFVEVPEKNEVRHDGLGGSASADWFYTGQGDKNQIANDMLARVKSTGFSNATLESEDGWERIMASCEGMALDIHIQHPDNSPIQVSFFRAYYPNTPRCPQFDLFAGSIFDENVGAEVYWYFIQFYIIFFGPWVFIPLGLFLLGRSLLAKKRTRKMIIVSAAILATGILLAVLDFITHANGTYN